jgi:hypothetical protein
MVVIYHRNTPLLKVQKGLYGYRVGEGPSSRRPHAPGIKKNRNAERCHNWIRTRAGEMAAKRETTVSAGEGPSGGGVNPMPKTRVVDWILLDAN